MARSLSRCPVCQGAMGIKALACGSCGARIEADFDSCHFCRLSPEHSAIIELFLQCEGNLSRMEEHMNVSYPTVRNRLTASLAALNLGPPGRQPPPDRSRQAVSSGAGQEIAAARRGLLKAVENGSLTPEAAAEQLRAIEETSPRI